MANSKAPGKRLAAQRAKARRKAAAKPQPKPSTRKRKKTAAEKRIEQLRGHVVVARTTIRKAKGRAAKKARFKDEPKPVRNYANRAIAKGQTPKTALEQGRILHQAGRLANNGTLKKRGGGKLSVSNLRKLIGR